MCTDNISTEKHQLSLLAVFVHHSNIEITQTKPKINRALGD